MSLKPLAKSKRSDFSSPSKLAQDQLLLPFLTRNNEFMFSSTEALARFFKKKEIPVDPNPYSMQNLNLPEEKKIVLKKKNIYKVQTIAEIK